MKVEVRTNNEIHAGTMTNYTHNNNTTFIKIVGLQPISIEDKNKVFAAKLSIYTAENRKFCIIQDNTFKDSVGIDEAIEFIKFKQGKLL